MATRWVNPEPVPEGVGWRYQGTLKDEAEAAIPAATFTTMTIKIYVLNAALTSIAGDPTPVNILNTGRGTLDATTGLLTITFLPTDSAMNDSTRTDERHLALVEGDYAGDRKFAHEIQWRVVNLNKR